MPALPLDSKSLTPQRKHRKLMKDGSGTEVWPERLEEIFVQGLKEYWVSPWATYTQSRGRSRWRNQFLVDYLQKAGITRTKKQVASHIQVLRNMWRGEPEYYLVAGGEELLSEAPASASPSVKVEESANMQSLVSFDQDDPNDAAASPSTSPDFSPPDSIAEFPPSPHMPTGVSGVHSQNVSPPFQIASPDTSPVAFNREFSLFPPTISGTSTFFSDLIIQEPPNLRKSLPYTGSPSDSSPTSISAHFGPPSVHASNTIKPATHYPPIPFIGSTENRVTAVCLVADGMPNFSVKTDVLITPRTTRSILALKIKLCIPSVNDIRSPTTLHGFVGSICLAKVWSTSGRCITRVYPSSHRVPEEDRALDITSVEVGTAVALLPESPLSRCRWFDVAVQTTITQEIIVDGETLLYLIYYLDRHSTALPSAELVGFQKTKAPIKPIGQSTGNSVAPTVGDSFSGYQSPRQPVHTSLSYALTPINNIR